EVAIEPLQESRLKDTSASIEGIAGEPDQFGLLKAQLLGLLQLFPKLIGVNQIAKAYVDGAIDERKRSGCLGEALPDELQHQQFINIGVEQRPRNGVHFPVMVVCAPREVDDHDATTLPHSGCPAASVCERHGGNSR